jgi:Mg2+ and Co2+ transporter CorA
MSRILAIAVGLALLSGCGGTSQTHREAEEVAALLRKEERLSKRGHEAEAESRRALAISEGCLGTGDYACSEAESASAELLSEVTEGVARGLRRIHQEVNSFNREAIKAGYKEFYQQQ